MNNTFALPTVEWEPQFSLAVSDPAKKEDQGNAVYQATVWVFANISGMISLKPDGTIHSLNENFARLLFGYARSELVGHSISKLIPDFFGLLDMESNPLPLPPMDDDEEEEEEGVELLFGEFWCLNGLVMT